MPTRAARQRSTEARARFKLRWILFLALLCGTLSASSHSQIVRLNQEDNADHRNVNNAPARSAEASFHAALVTNWSSPNLNLGDTFVTVLEITSASSGEKLRIQRSNVGARYFTTDFYTAITTAIASVPGVKSSQITAQQIELTLTAGTYNIAISQTVTSQAIREASNDAAGVAGQRLQVDWLLSGTTTNSTSIDSGHAVISRWITFESLSTPPGPITSASSSPASARWTLLRSAPNVRPGETVTFEIDETNYPLQRSTTLKIGLAANSADDGAFLNGVDAAITAALTRNVSYDERTHELSFGPKTVFPFVFKMIANGSHYGTDYVLSISQNEIGQIDVATAGVRLGDYPPPPEKPIIGVNQASGEFGVGDFKYTYPGVERIDWVAAQGFGIVRLPFLFQNVQAASEARLNETAMRMLDPVLKECQVKRVVCLLDLHNYGSYYQDASTNLLGVPGSLTTSNKRIAGFWAQIADRYKNNSYVWFGLMNEPNKQTPIEWVKTSNAIASAIRETGAVNKIIFSGTAWDGAWTWETSGNALHMLKAYDPGNNYAFEAHQYLDKDGSGTSPICVPGAGHDRLVPFTEWLTKHRLQGLIGEVGWAASSSCATEGAALLDHWISATSSTGSGGYIGLTYWSNGPWWPDSYMFLAEPRPFPDGASPPQLDLLKRYLPN